MIAEAWERLSARGPGWYWIGTHLRNGDMYHVCSLAKRFVEAYGRTLPIYLVAGLKPQMAVASAFSEYFAEIIQVEEFLGTSPEQWDAFFRERGLPAFGPNTPIILHPAYAEDTRGERFDAFVNTNDLTWMLLYNRILRLPTDAEPAAPAFKEETAREAEALCRDAGVVQGRSVLLFPYAQSFDVPALNHFAELAARLKERGLEVFTSVAGAEVPVEGTRPMFIPFSVLRDVAEYAGWVVAIRSGICDVTSSARCTKSFIYRIGKELPNWGVNAMNFCRDAIEIPFHVELQTPQVFSDLVLNNRATELRYFARARLSDMLEAQLPGRVSTHSFVEIQRNPERLPAVVELARKQIAEGRLVRFTEMPDRDHPRWRPVIDEFLNALIPTGDPGAWSSYTCRDHGRFDFFEEVDANYLSSALYRASSVFHTVIMTAGEALDVLLLDPERGHVLPIEASLTGEAIDVGAQADGYAFATYLQGRRPFSLSGIQLVEGWEDVEFWGAWSRGRRGSLKIALAETPTSGFGLFLACRGSLTRIFPSTGYNVRVNGRVVSSGEWELVSNSRILRLEVPDDIATAGRLFRVDIEVDEVRTPRQQGAAADDRQLGVALHWVRLDAPGEPAPIVRTEGWFGGAAEFEALLVRQRESRERAGSAEVGVFTLGQSPFLHRDPENGWHSGEEWGRWSASSSAVIRFKFNSDSPVQGLRLNLFAPTHPSLDRVTGSVRLNGASAQPISGDMAEANTHVVFDRAAFIPDAVNELEVVSDKLVRPCDLDSGNEDARPLGFAVTKLEFF